MLQGPLAPPTAVALIMTLPPGMFGRKKSSDCRNQGPVPDTVNAFPRLSETLTLAPVRPPNDTAAISRLPTPVLFSVTEIGGLVACDAACIWTKLIAVF